MWGAGPEAKNIQMPKAQRESSHQALQSCTKSPHTKRATSPNVLQKSRSQQLSIPGHSSAPRISCVSVLIQTGPRSSTSSATIFARPPDLQASRPHGRLIFDLMLLRLLQFKCLAQNFFWGQTSGSSYGALVSAVFVSSPVSLTLFQLPSLVRASSQ